MRYLTCESLDAPYTAYNLAVYKNGGEWPSIFIYSIIEIPAREVRLGKLATDAQYNTNLQGEQFTKALWVNGFKQHEIFVKGRYASRETREFELKDCSFFFDHLQCGDISIEAKDIGFNSFPSIFKQNVLEGSIRITGEFEWRLRPNAFSTSSVDRFTKQLTYKPGSIDLSNSDFSLIKQVIVDAEKNKAMQRVLAKLRAELAKGKFVSEQTVLEWCTLEELENVDVRKVIEGETFKKDYEAAFFRALKEQHDEEHQIYYSKDGFVFYINGHWVWELPEYGAATYLFLDAELSGDELVVCLGGVTRKQILDDDATRALLHYVGRSIHPKDAENETYFSRWLDEVSRRV